MYRAHQNLKIVGCFCTLQWQATEYKTTYSFLLLHSSLLWFIDFGSSATTGVFFTEFVFKLFPLSFPFAGWSWRSLQIKHKYYQTVLISLCSIPFAFLYTVYRVIFGPMLFCFLFFNTTCKRFFSVLNLPWHSRVKYILFLILTNYKKNCFEFAQS